MGWCQLMECILLIRSYEGDITVPVHVFRMTKGTEHRQLNNDGTNDKEEVGEYEKGAVKKGIKLRSNYN